LRSCSVATSLSPRSAPTFTAWSISASIFIDAPTGAQTLLEVAADPRHLGAEIGFFSVLHTWDQRLLFHPHIHCVLPAGGLAPDHDRWISSSRRFFLPVKVLSRVFRGKFVAGLRTAFDDGSLRFHHSLLHLADLRRFPATTTAYEADE
jgi:hypothetical protein